MSNNNSTQQSVSFGKKLLVAFLYLIQGVYLNVPGTIVLTYKQVPSYSILAYFSMAILPFSLKFLSAPFIEKYSSLSYGRRKTWVVISLLGAGFLLLVISPWAVLESPQKQIQLALLFFFVVFLISLEDVSTDALAIKQLQSSEMASYMQCIMQPIGGVLGSLFMLELVTDSLSNRLGLPAPILTVPQYLYILAGITFVSAIIIHFLYTQTVTAMEEEGVPHSLWEVIKHYKHFINPRYRMFRQGITSLLYVHGLLYFSSSYVIELIKNHGYSKELLTTLQNACLIPIFILTHFLSEYWSSADLLHKRTRIILGLRLVAMMTIFLFNVTDPTLASACLIVLTFLSHTQFFLVSLINNTFSNSKFAGMYVTMMASLTNLGNNSTVQLQVLDRIGYHKATVMGFGYTIIVLLMFGRIERWIKNGQEDQDMASVNETEKTTKTE